jgi:hypothetical protein
MIPRVEAMSEGANQPSPCAWQGPRLNHRLDTGLPSIMMSS